MRKLDELKNGLEESVSDEAAVDLSVLRQLTELEATSPGLVARLLQIFFDGAPTHIAAVASAVAARDAMEVRRHAHALKGSSLNIGATRLANLCQRIEVDAQLGNFTGAEEWAGRLEDQLEFVRETMELKSP